MGRRPIYLIAAILLGAPLGAANAQSPAQAPELGTSLDTIVDYQAIIDESEKSRPPETSRPPELTRRPLRGIDPKKRDLMRRIDEQGGERANLSRPAGGGFMMKPVLGRRRQDGNPPKLDLDLQPRKAVGLDFTLDF